MELKDFHTREPANAGVRLPLHDIHTGKDSGEWLLIMGTDSDRYRSEERRLMRMVAEVATEKVKTSLTEKDPSKLPQDDDDEIRTATIELKASLVKDWSFDDECTKANVVNFITEAPHIGDMIDKFATQRRNFIAKKLTNSAGG